MGNTKSTSQGKLTLVLDPPPSATSTGGAYIAGETISGSVYAQTKSNIAPSRINIRAYISGKERSRVRYSATETPSNANGSSSSRTVTRFKYADRQIVHMNVNLGAVATGVEAGSRYRFPFAIQLPADLPSTMHCSEDRGSRNGGHCEITYKIKAELKGPGVFGNQKVESMFYIMSSPLPSQPVPNLIPPNYQTINYFGCIPAGTITMGARVENTRIGRGEAVAIDFACKNQSRRGINRAEARIIEEVSWKVGRHQNHTKKTLVYRTFRPTEQWIKIKKGELKKLKTSAKIQSNTFRDKEQMMLQDIYKAIFDGENRAVLNLPPSSLHSYKGILIQVGHRLKIKVFTDGLCTDNPRFKLPIFIGTPSGLLGGPVIPVVNAIPAVDAIPSAPVFSSVPTPSAPPAEWTGAVTASIVKVSSSTAVVGGGTIYEAEGENAHNTSDVDAEEEMFMPIAEVVPSLPNLTNEIILSVSPLSVVKKRLNQDEWRAVFDTMTPLQYECVMKAVTDEFDQPEMAALVAPAIRSGKFTHEYVVAALHVVAAWLRIPLIERLVPLCVDLEENSSIIVAELSDWERVCTQQYFRDSLTR